MTVPPKSTLWQRPATGLGRWAVSVSGVFLVMFLLDTIVLLPLSMAFPDAPWRQEVLPFYGVLMIASGLVGGIAGLAALLWKRDRSWLVWLTLIPGALILLLLLGELLIPH